MAKKKSRGRVRFTERKGRNGDNRVTTSAMNAEEILMADAFDREPPEGTIEGHLAAIEEIGYIRVAGLCREMLDRLEPHRGEALDAIEAAKASRSGSDTYLTLLELLTSSTDLYSDFADQLIEVHSELDPQVRGRTSAEQIKHDPSVLTAALHYFIHHNPLFYQLHGELVGLSELAHASAALKKAKSLGSDGHPDLFRVMARNRRDAVAARGVGNYYRNAIVDGVAQVHAYERDITWSARLTPEQEEELSDWTELYRWEQLAQDNNPEFLPIPRTGSKKERDAAIQRSFQDAQTPFHRADFKIPLKDPETSASFHIAVRLTTLTERRLLSAQGNMDPLVSLLIFDASENKTLSNLPLVLSRATGELTLPYHSFVGVKHILDPAFCDSIRYAVMKVIDRLVDGGSLTTVSQVEGAHEMARRTAEDITETVPETQQEVDTSGVQEYSEVEVETAVSDDDTVHGDQPTAEQSSEPLQQEGAQEPLQQEAALEEEIDWFDHFPGWMRIGTVMGALKRAEPGLIVRSDGKHPVLINGEGKGAPTYTFLNEHGGRKGSIPGRITRNVVRTLQIDPAAFLTALGGQYKRTVKRLRRGSERNESTNASA